MNKNIKDIFFLGNSLSMYNQGVNVHLEQLTLRGRSEICCNTDSLFVYGQTLKTLWLKHGAVDKVSESSHDCVVLQDDLPETDVDTFREYVKKFTQLIRSSGSEPLLFMAWNYDRLNWISMEAIAAAHEAVAEELKLRIAPVGLAWKSAMEQMPELNLYSSDGEHPTIEGTYLAAAVLYSVIFKENPSLISYNPDGMDNTLCSFLRTIAWTTASEYTHALLV